MRAHVITCVHAHKHTYIYTCMRIYTCAHVHAYMVRAYACIHEREIGGGGGGGGGGEGGLREGHERRGVTCTRRHMFIHKVRR
jgi:hypothetical protein